MTIALVGQVKGNGNDTFSTSSLDTTGADLLVATYAFASVVPTLTDSKSNTWTQARLYRPFDPASAIYYAWNPTVGTGHTITLTGTDFFGSAQLSAFSGVDTASDPLDQGNNNHAFGATTVQPGSVTPSEDDELIITHLNFDSDGTGMPTLNGGFSSPAFGDQGSGGVYNGSGVSYLIQTTATAANPTWTKPGSGQNLYATIATFKADAGPPPPGPTLRIAQSGLRLG